MSRTKTVSIVIMLFVLGLAACSGPTNNTDSSSPEEDIVRDNQENIDGLDEEVVLDDLFDDPTEILDELDEMGGEKPVIAKNTVKEFTMIARNWEFEPSTITVNKGDTVRLSVESVDRAHGIMITEYGVARRLEPGIVEEIEFVADIAGTFTFRCFVPCGGGHSRMTGSLIVN